MKAGLAVKRTSRTDRLAATCSVHACAVHRPTWNPLLMLCLDCQSEAAAALTAFGYVDPSYEPVPAVA